MAATSNPTITLNNGHKMPAIGYGTWQAKPGEVGEAVYQALKTGVRSIDCAKIYRNQEEVGRAFTRFFKEGNVKREEVFITSKLWNTEWADPVQALKTTLKELELDYLDLYLVHTAQCWEPLDGELGPDPKKANFQEFLESGKTSVKDMWQGMEKGVDQGLTRAIGVSNFPVLMIKDLLTYARIKPAIQQNEIHPYFQQKGNTEWCLKHGIQITCYSSLALASPALKEGHEKLPEDPKVVELAKKYNRSAAQVLLRWAVDKGYSIIPKSLKPERIAENFNLDFTISADDIKQLDALERGFRTVPQDFFGHIPYYE